MAEAAMQGIDIFSLAKHAGPYAEWPATTPLQLHGQATHTRVPGFVLEAQYRCGDRYLLATSWDCPYEEMQTFVLLSAELKVLARKDYGAPYATVWLDSHEALAPDRVAFHCNNGCDVIITVRPRRPLLFGSLLHMRIVDPDR